MKHKYTLPKKWIDKVSSFEEFANGGAQVTIRTKDGKVFEKILLSNSSAIIAMRGNDDLPFSIEDIAEIFQSDEDRNPKERDNWKIWDSWRP